MEKLTEIALEHLIATKMLISELKKSIHLEAQLGIDSTLTMQKLSENENEYEMLKKRYIQE